MAGSLSQPFGRNLLFGPDVREIDDRRPADDAREVERVEIRAARNHVARRVHMREPVARDAKPARLEEIAAGEVALLAARDRPPKMA